MGEWGRDNLRSGCPISFRIAPGYALLVQVRTTRIRWASDEESISNAGSTGCDADLRGMNSTSSGFVRGCFGESCGRDMVCGSAAQVLRLEEDGGDDDGGRGGGGGAQTLRVAIAG